MNRNIFLSFVLFLTTSIGYAETKPDENIDIVSINGVIITKQEIQHFISKLSKPVPAERALQEMINVELLTQAAKDQGMMKDSDLLLEIKRSTSGVIASHYLQKQLLNFNITKEDLKARYAKDYVDNNQEKEFNANHILVKTEDEAKDIIQQLDQGAKFAELAKKLSTGPSGKNGGSLGWFKSTDMVQPFSQATMKLAKGQYSKLAVKTQFGFHVIKLNDTRTTETPSFDSVSKKLSSAIAVEKINDVMTGLHKSASIVFTDKK